MGSESIALSALSLMGNDSELIWAPAVIIVKHCTLRKINAVTDELISELI